MTDAAPAAGPRRSTLAVAALVLAAVPTGAGQLLAFALAPMALVEIAVSRGREQGRLLALAALGLATLWTTLAVQVGRGIFAHRESVAAERDQSGPNCERKLLDLARALADARAHDPQAMPRTLEALLAEGWCTGADLRCPADMRSAPPTAPPSYRLVAAPRDPAALESCLLVVETAPRHAKEGRAGGYVLYADGHVSFRPARQLEAEVRAQERRAGRRGE